MLRKVAKYTKLLRYMRLKNSTRIRVGKLVLNLDNNIHRSEGLWRLMVLLDALDSGIIAELDYSSLSLKFCIDLIKFEVSLNHYSYVALRHVTMLHLFGAKFENDIVHLPQGIMLRYPREDPFALGCIIEIFCKSQYGFLNVSRKMVADVGAYIGDSAIYFALRGAKKVACYEPHPILYRYLIENVK